MKPSNNLENKTPSVVSGRIARVFNRSGASPAVALATSKAFERVWHACLLHKFKSYGVLGQIFGLVSSFLSNRWLQVFLDRNSSQEYAVNVGVPQGSFLFAHFCYYTLMSFLMILSVVLLSMLMILLSTLNVIRHLICGNK